MKPALRRIIRDEHTLQYGAHPLRAVLLSGLTEAVRQWIEGLDGTRDLECVLKEAASAGLDEIRARSLLDQLAAQGALHDAATSPAPIADLPLAERDRLRPDLDALDLASTAPDGAIGLFARRRERRVRVYGAGRVGAQVVALLAASGVGNIRVLDPGTARPCDITPGGLTWTEVGLPREIGAALIATRLTSGGPTPTPTGSLRPEAPQPIPTTSTGSTRANNNTRATTPSRHFETTPTAQTTQPHHPTQATQRPPATQSENETHTTQVREDTHAAQAGKGPQSTGSARTARPTSSARTPYSTNSARAERPTVPLQRARPAAPLADEPDEPDEPPRTNKNTRAGKDARTGKAVRARESMRAGESVRAGEDLRPSVNALAGGPYLGDKSDRPDLVILTPVGPLDGVLVNELTSLGIPHLLASAFEGHGTVGPLVIPGKTACLHCLDLTRRDRDPMWPIVTARLGGYPPGEIACDATLAALVAAAVVGHALAHLDDRESAVTNGTMDVTPDWRWKRRSWTLHPQCRCMRNNPYSLRMVMSPNRD
ncbi:hypothetical protein [Nonomuraea sp. NPDC005650]|uniref:hypothetical protein n=1 Tax=Nonomuraea sp. NPDC005650 TaxID=3157045 RepID=UPI0033AF6009